MKPPRNTTVVLPAHGAGKTIGPIQRVIRDRLLENVILVASKDGPDAASSRRG